MNVIVENFHFLRPFWLLAIIPAGMLFMAIRHLKASANRWDKAIDRQLLPYLLDGASGPRFRWPAIILLISWLLASLSLAGPTWEKLPQAVKKKADALVVIQDLSVSFLATDLSPNRLTRARHKLFDILQARKEGTTALIVYSGDAHVVAPLTDDTNTIIAMIPDLSPVIMPSYGSNLQAAVKMALNLFKAGGVGSGRILLLTDEVEENQMAEVVDLLAGKNIILSVLGVGTEDGGPIPKNDGGFLKDEQDNIVIPRLNRNVLLELAKKGDGRYSDLKIDDSDFSYLLAQDPLEIKREQYRQIDREFDQWQEQGHWLVLLILPFALLAFRRGWLIGLVLMILLSANDAQAMQWQDLWLRPDQQGAKALADNDPRQAAELFKSRQWQGAAEYRAGNYEGAIAAFNELESGDDNYNLGNALAHKGEFDKALNAYDKALQLSPDMEDASFNRKLVEKLMQEQKQQQEQGENQDKESDKQQQSKENGEQGQDSPNQSQEQENKDQQEGQGDQSKEAGEQETQENEDSALNDQHGQQDQSAEQDDQPHGEKDSSAGQQEEQGEGEQSPSGKNQVQEEKLSAEEKQALEQWLRQIPDNPGGLLKRKFQYQYQQNPERNSPKNKKIW